MTTRLFSVFQETLRVAMAKKSMSQQDLARASGVHFVTINRILQGAVDNISFDVAEKLLVAAGVSPEKIFRKIA